MSAGVVVVSVVDAVVPEVSVIEELEDEAVVSGVVEPVSEEELEVEPDELLEELELVELLLDWLAQSPERVRVCPLTTLMQYGKPVAES